MPQQAHQANHANHAQGREGVAPTGRALRTRQGPTAQGAAQAHAACAIGHQHGQHKARGERRANQTRHRKQTQLRQPRKARKHQGQKAAHRGEQPQAHRGPTFAHPMPPTLACGLTLTATGLDEEVNRVVHCLANQGGAKTQRDAVHRTHAQAHRGNARHHAAGHRQHGRAQGQE